MIAHLTDRPNTRTVDKGSDPQKKNGGRNMKVQFSVDARKYDAEIIHAVHDFPIDGEMYIVGRYDGKYFFAWGHSIPRGIVEGSVVPSSNIHDGEDGIGFFETLEEAEEEMYAAIRAIRAFEDETWFEDHEDVQHFLSIVSR